MKYFVLVIAVLLPLRTESHDLFQVSPSEQAYFDSIILGLKNEFAKRNFVNSIREERGVTESQAMELLSEMATLSAVCTVLGTRLYKSDIKQHISEIIYNKGTSVDVRVGIEDFIRSGIRKGEMEHADLLTPILQGIEFAEMCMDTVKEDPLP